MWIANAVIIDCLLLLLALFQISHSHSAWNASKDEEEEEEEEDSEQTGTDHICEVSRNYEGELPSSLCFKSCYASGCRQSKSH